MLYHRFYPRFIVGFLPTQKGNHGNIHQIDIDVKSLFDFLPGFFCYFI